MDAISQMTFSNVFSWMKMFDYCLKFHWRLFLRVHYFDYIKYLLEHFTVSRQQYMLSPTHVPNDAGMVLIFYGIHYTLYLTVTLSSVLITDMPNSPVMARYDVSFVTSQAWPIINFITVECYTAPCYIMSSLAPPEHIWNNLNAYVRF